MTFIYLSNLLAFRSFRISAFFAFFTIVVACGNNKTDETGNAAISHLARIVFVNPSDTSETSRDEKNDLLSLKHSLRVDGFPVTEITENSLTSVNLKEYNILVLPYATARRLTKQEINMVKDAVHSGLNIILDGYTDASLSLGIKPAGPAILVTAARDTFVAKNKLFWTVHCSVEPVENTQNKLIPLTVDDSTHRLLSVAGNFGTGKFIYFASLFDPVTDKGYTRYPFLTETIGRIFNIRPLASRRAAEMYFDPGERDAEFPTIDSLARQWRKEKIKRIYAAGWYYDTDYDYTALLKACHENGILVYCWLETPMISINFWNKHPEWREKTVFQKDAQIDWRYLMNLADENCRNQIFKETGDFLLKHDWDGVDFAELYFEPSPVGPALPENFTPMNTLVREEFKKTGGFDPILLFDPKNEHYWEKNDADWKKFAAYRKDLCYRLKKHFLDFFASVKKQKTDFEVMLTVLDVSITPELSDYIGEDTKNTLALYRDYDITMQIEDPSNCWGLTPERYDRIGKLYRKNVKGTNKLVFDCNVVNAHEAGFGGFPSVVPTGEEIRQIAYNMNLHHIRPAFYSENVVSDNDYKNISNVLAGETSILAGKNNILKINTPSTVLLETDTKNPVTKLDNRTWLAGEDGEIIIPTGSHTLDFASSQTPQQTAYRLLNISGELLSARFDDDALTFTYSEDITSCYAALNRMPSQIFIDSKKSNCTVFKSGNRFTLKLPQGKHTVRIID